MPHFVKPEYTGDEVQLFGDVNNRADGIQQPSRQHPPQSPYRNNGEHWFDHEYCHPAHHQVDSGSHPARRLDDEQLDHHPRQRECPDERQESPLQDAGEEVEADGRVGAGDEHIDGGVVELTQFGSICIGYSAPGDRRHWR